MALLLLYRVLYCVDQAFGFRIVLGESILSKMMADFRCPLSAEAEVE